MTDVPADTITVAIVPHRDTGGGPAQLRVDLADARRHVTLASLDPEYALIVAVRVAGPGVGRAQDARLGADRFKRHVDAFGSVACVS